MMILPDNCSGAAFVQVTQKVYEETLNNNKTVIGSEPLDTFSIALF